MGTAWKVSGSGGTAGTWQTEHGRHQGDRAVRTAPGVGTAGRRCSPRPEGLVFWMETAHNKTPRGGRDAEEKMRGSYVPPEQHPGGTLGDAGPSFPKPGSMSSRGPRKLSEGQSGLRWLGWEAGPQRLGGHAPIRGAGTRRSSHWLLGGTRGCGGNSRSRWERAAAWTRPRWGWSRKAGALGSTSQGRLAGLGTGGPAGKGAVGAGADRARPGGWHAAGAGPLGTERPLSRV